MTCRWSDDSDGVLGNSHGMDPSTEVLDAKHTRVASAAERRQHVRRPGDVVTDGGRRERSEEHRSCISDQGEQVLSVINKDLEVLWRDPVLATASACSGPSTRTA